MVAQGCLTFAQADLAVSHLSFLTDTLIYLNVGLQGL